MIKTVTPARAAEILREHGMRTKAKTIRCGIEQGKFPFGEVIIRENGGKRCYIYKKLLDDWIKQREAI